MAVLSMGKKKGQRKPAAPPEPDEKQGTDTVRVYSDLKRMVKAITEVEGIDAPELMDEVARDRITARFEPYREYWEQKEARDREETARLAEVRKHHRKEPE